MSAVTIDEAWPGFGGPFTVADLHRMPGDGYRYEFVDGTLVVGPRPKTVHRAVAGRRGEVHGAAVAGGGSPLATPPDLTKGLPR
jgi:hypothetical protein